MSLHKKVRFHALYDNKQFCGIVYFAEGDATVYLAYLAISKKLRGRGYGTDILKVLENEFSDKQIVIDIEPVIREAQNYKQRISRLNFYERNGFHRTHQMLKDDAGECETLTTGKKFDRAGFIKTLKQMSFGFYQFKVEK